ncbi:MAG: hypothetical protein ABSB19_19155 [Methylomonas sp.]|jgi:hypothetical protein
MRKTNRFIYNTAIICPVLLVAACSSQPTPPPAPAPAPLPKVFSGEQMMRDSQGIAQLGSRWQEGKQKVDKGQALQRQGQAQIDEGQSLVDEGQKIMRESEEGYKSLKQ